MRQLRPVQPVVGMVLLAALAALPAAAEDDIPPQLSLERHLRQVYLDLLGRPPTIEEYRAAQAKGAVDVEDVRKLMDNDAFYMRMRMYHRALFQSNISASVLNNGDTRLLNTGAPSATSSSAADAYEMRGNPALPLRGRQGLGCDHFIKQSACNASRQDPHSEPTTAKACYDADGVPLPVSYDYDVAMYQCTRLDDKDSTVTSCSVAVTKGLLADEELYFCDMRRDSANSTRIRPYRCIPDPAKPATAALTEKIREPGTNRIIAYATPANAPTRYPTLNRCTLTLGLRSGVKGSYLPQTGCVQREGYELRPPPYWDNSGRTEVAVCAIEAQTRAVNPVTSETCETSRFTSDRSCGCGVGARRCESGNQSVHLARVAAFNAEPELIADSVLRRDEPYFNTFTTRRSFVNGTLSAFFRDGQGTRFWELTPPADPVTLPQLPYHDTGTWKEYTRAEHHSGVLSTPAFLLRFPTHRARINQVYDALLCRSFSPPAGVAPPSPDDACNRENNLAIRCGCSSCHASLEPLGAHWGRSAERTATYLDPEKYPRFDSRCRDCALNGDTNCGGQCSQYVMQAFDEEGAESLGMLKTYLYRTPEEEVNIEGGPRLLVERMMRTGELERCVVRRIWQEFLGRPMSRMESALYLDGLAKDFATDNHRLKGLIERILTSDAYRRID
ncbi:MAG: DUF1585 domain-containing protein [Myxococcaceae bacterium]